MAQNRVSRLMQEDRKFLIAYYMPEFPLPGSTLPVLEALQKSGVDIIELGMPYSDPIGDGPVIQDAAHTAIGNGVHIAGILDLVRKARAGEGCEKITVPLLLMGYCSPLIAYGGDCFLSDASEAGVDGLLIPDLPPEEAEDFLFRARGFGLSVIFFISPETPPERIGMIDGLSTDFSYCFAVNATTGTAKLAGADSERDIESYLRRVREHTKKKFVVGFGIKDRARVEKMWNLADGAVVGTALLQAIRNASTPEEVALMTAEFWKTLKS
ncbi:MAG: tryptophan synthase subunit alpha [Chlorobium phaeobacteroides]|uniref:Tryptophan synthase alpha chain n=1 Tax=Chlorobium phaeobacteroides (strain BS1) TaxID=331678 RepID=TRPA_CHLPB|nr:RecName: Full=Tryptophan synthase alpha chain [Chlorobium phaeobacteroides BS1]MBC8524951.1 tryptophan synthase subunit alpha [Chlorobium phaeobacteroides]MBL6955928.1 tryptophan synthase subunit alpha [Chlorobium phaeobacteroides]NEX13584.1 tryptophan synthase subunit alpha [Prosthecochloris sp.]